MTNFEIPIKIYFGEFEEIIKQLGQLQTYKLVEGAEEVLVDANDVARVLAKHVKATSAQPDNRLKKFADIVEGTIDHLDRDDAMDMLYQIKEVLK